MNAMPMPEWATDEAKDEVAALEGTHAAAVALQFVPVTNYSTHFAEWLFRGKDLLVHIFPRAGLDDEWSPTQYDDQGNYVAARREEKAAATFSGSMEDHIQAAVDKTWMGDFAVDLVPELGAYAIQFQDAKTAVEVAGPGKFVDTFCEALDTQLD